MHRARKIATCCYCGSRAALVLTGEVRHELACSKCGAPLHEMKMLRSDARGERELVASSAVRASKKKNKHHRAPKSKFKKHRKSRFSRAIWDIAEDVLEEVFDVFD